MHVFKQPVRTQEQCMLVVLRSSKKKQGYLQLVGIIIITITTTMIIPMVTDPSQKHIRSHQNDHSPTILMQRQTVDIVNRHIQCFL